MITIQNYVRAQSLQEAWELNQNKRSRIIGGMLWLKMGKTAVHTAIDLGALRLNTIEETAEAFSIGCSVTLRQLEKHEALNEYFNGTLCAAVRDIVGVQFRNLATVGGSIFGRFGFSDVLTVFLAADTEVELYRGGRVPLEEFVKMKKDRDVLVRLWVKKRPAAFRYEAMRNARTDFPILTCAVSCVEGTYGAVIGARPARARLLWDEKGFLKEGVTADTARAFADYAAKKMPVSGNHRGSAAYRTHLVRVLTERAVLELGGDHNGN